MVRPPIVQVDNRHTPVSWPVQQVWHLESETRSNLKMHMVTKRKANC